MLSIHSARSLAPQNARPAPEYLPAAPATAVAPAGKHKFDETDPDGISRRAHALPDRDVSPPAPGHPRSPACRRRFAPLLLLPAPAVTSPAWLAACLQSHPEKLCRDLPVRIFLHAGLPLP